MGKQGTEKGRRVMLVPYPFQGHMTPMLQLGTVLHSRGFSVTIAHSELNSPNPSNYPGFTYLPLADNLSEEDTKFNKILNAISALNINCKAPLQEYLKKLDPNDRISCIIYDPIMYFSAAVADKLNIPSIILRTCPANDLVPYLAVPQLDAEGYFPLKESVLFDLVPGLHPLRFKDLPLTYYGSEISEMYAALAEKKTSSAMIWNTVDYIEHSSLKRLQPHYQLPFFPIGPLHKIAVPLSTSLLKEDSGCIPWLDKQSPHSVIYVSLGSLAIIEEKELIETAWGLANSGQPFLWVVRPGSVVGSEWTEHLPEGFEQVIGERGRIVKWAPQKEVLRHPAVGGFWSHCGWNSTLESICEGVPLICRPSFSDQKVNARYLTHVWKVGVELKLPLERDEVARTSRRLMVEEEGEEMRKRAARMKEKVTASVQIGGSSYNALNDLTAFISSF